MQSFLLLFVKTRKCIGNSLVKLCNSGDFETLFEMCMHISLILYLHRLHIWNKSMFLEAKVENRLHWCSTCGSLLTRVHAQLRAHSSLSTNTSILCPTAPRMGKSESQMDIMEKSTKPRKHRWTVVEIGLSVIVLLMSCALAGLIVLYTSALRGGHFCCRTARFWMLFIQTPQNTQTCSRSL